VVDGRTHHPGRIETPNYYNTPQNQLVIDRRKPGRDYMHILRKRDIARFIDLIPDWPALSRGLDAIVLSAGSPEIYGWHIPGVIHLGAWPRGLWERVDTRFVWDNAELLFLLQVAVEPAGKNLWLLQWTRLQARAFLLLDVLLHELGHHHDRIHTRSQWNTARGEAYADEFARQTRRGMWREFQERFALD
jgi:hypothetical protein